MKIAATVVASLYCTLFLNMSQTFLEQLINSIDCEPAIGDDPWYVLSRKWWQLVLDAHSEGLEDPDLQDVDNMELIDSSENQDGMNKAILKRDLKEGIDYIMIPKKSWEMIHDRYGGGPAFAKNVIEIQGKAQIEIFPYKLKVTYINRPSETLTPSEGSQLSAIPTIKAMVFEFSKKTTIKQMKTEIFEAFEIDQETAPKLSLYNYFDDLMGEPLEDYVHESHPGSTQAKESPQGLATIHSTRLSDNQSLLIDLKQDHPVEEIDDNEQIGTNGDVSSSSSNPQEPLTLQQILSKPTAFKRGVCGLRNLGNTCFMNSALQCLSATMPLTEYFLTGKHMNELNTVNPLGKKGELAREFGTLMATLWNGKAANIIPRDFKWMLCNFEKRFDDYSQHDSQELLAFLLDGLHEDVNRVLHKPLTSSIDISSEDDQSIIEAAKKSWDIYKLRNDSVIVDLFQAQLKSKLECPDCGHLSITFDPFMYLSLPIPTDSVRTREIQFVFRHGILKCAIQLPRSSPMSAVKSQLQAMTGVSASRILLADVHQSKVHKRFHNTDRLDSVAASDNLVAYELQYDISSPLIQKVIIPVYQRKFMPEWDQKTGRWSSRSAFVGMPFFVVVNKHITYGDLFNEVKRQVVQFVNLNNPPVNLVKYPFTLSKIKQNGQTICSWAEWSHGSPVLSAEGTKNVDKIPGKNSITKDMDLHIVLSAGDIIGLDWDMSVASNLIPQPRMVSVKEHHDFQQIMNSGKALASKTTSIIDCFKAFTKPEKLDGGNQWRCPKCQADKEATKSISIWSLPEILVVHLKRFSENVYTRSKLSNMISYPLESLDLKPYISQRPPGTHDDNFPQSTVYDLFAVSNHYGGMSGGHYTATAQNFVDGEWYEFDDHNAHHISPNEAISDAAYVLFYRRRMPGSPSKL